MKRLMLASITTLALILAALPVHADGPRIRIRRGGDRDHYSDRVIDNYSVSPNGSIVIRRRYGHDWDDHWRDHRNVIILPPAIGNPYPVYQPYPVAVPYPVVQPSVINRPSRQDEQPRLLHGQTIAPFNAVVYGRSQLAGREGPGSVYNTLTTFTPGQVVTATRVAGGADGYNWYLVASGSGQYAWLRGDSLSGTIR